jgi:hypothetical protein
MPLSPYVLNAFLNWFRGVATPAAPATIWVALCTADSDAAQVTSPAWPRQPVPWDVLSNPLQNGAPITWPDAPAVEGAITHWRLYDAAANGNYLATVAATPVQTVDAGERYVIDATKLKLGGS